MKPLYAITAWLLIAAQSLAGITYHGTTGQTVYARVQTGATTFVAVALTEGTSGGLGVYTATDAAIYAAGVKSPSIARGYPFTIRSGSASATVNDTIVGSGVLPWDGLGELSQLNIGMDGAVATSNRGDVAEQPRLPEWIEAPAATYFVRPTGNDGNSGTDAEDAFLTINAALAAKAADSKANCKIDIAGAISISGTQSLGTDVWLCGDGVVTMTRTNGLITGGAWTGTAVLTIDSGSNINLYGGDRCVITGIKLISMPTGTNGYSFPIGYKGTGVASKDVFVQDVWVTGDSDASYFSDGAVGAVGAWYFSNCILDSKFDSTQIARATMRHLAEYTGCIIRATGPTQVTSENGGDTRAVTAVGGKIRTKDCMILATGHKVGDFGSYGVCSRGNAVIEVSGGTVAGDDEDLFQDQGSTLIARAVEYESFGGNIIPDDDGINWARLRGKSTANTLASTTFSTSQQVASVTGNVAGSVGSVASGGISASSIASNAITSSKLATDAISAAAVSQAAAEKIGAEASGGSSTAGPILQRPIVASHVLQVRDRGNGTFGVIGEMSVTAGEPKQLWWLEFKGTQLAPGQNLYGMSAPTVTGTDAAKATVGTDPGETYGECLTKAGYEFQVDETAEAGADITVKIRVTFSAAGDGIDVYVPVNVKAAE